VNDPSLGRAKKEKAPCPACELGVRHLIKSFSVK
jgi:hypothetical protein